MQLNSQKNKIPAKQSLIFNISLHIMNITWTNFNFKMIIAMLSNPYKDTKGLGSQKAATVELKKGK